jgi:hypothetical protein
VTVDAETRAFILEAVKSTVQETLKKAPRPIFKPAVVASVDTESTLPQVICDGPEERPFGAQLLSGAVFPGDRVEIMFLDPHGAFIVGRRGGDYDPWHQVGLEEEPPFATGWTNASGSGGEGTDNHAVTKFRRLYRMVELRGLPGRASGGGTLIFTLPPDYRPPNNLSFVTTNGFNVALIEVRGYAAAVDPGGVIAVATFGPGVGSGVTLDSIKFSVDPGPITEE